MKLFKLNKMVFALVVLCLVAGGLFAGGKAEAKKQSLVFWGKQANDRATDELQRDILVEWGKKNNVDLEYIVITSEVQKQKYAAAFETKTVPDVVTFDGDFCKYWATKDVLLPVDDLYAELKKNGGGIFDGILPVLTEKGKLFGVPFQNDIYFFYVRKDLVEGVGEQLPQTWDDVARISLKIKAKYNIFPFGHPLSNTNDSEFTNLLIMWCFDSSIFDKDGKIAFNSPQTLEYLKFIQKMYAVDQTIPKGSITWNDANNNEAYQMKQAAFIINPGSVYRWVKENDAKLHENTILSRVPAGPRGTRANLTACWAVSLPKDSPKNDLAKECLRYLYKPEVYNKIIESAGSRYLPVYKDLFNTPFWKGNPKFVDLAKMLDEAKVLGYPGPASALASEMFVQRVLSTCLADVLVKGMSPEDAIKKADAKFREIATNFKN